MNIIEALMEKPWQPTRYPVSQSCGRQHTRLVALKWLISVISVLFFLFIVAFLMRSQYPDWQPLAEQSHQALFDKSNLWLNTIYLVIASFFIEIARVSTPHKKTVLVALALAGGFSCAFVAGQILFWLQLYGQGFVVNSHAAMSFFYLFTGLHALHIALGLLAWLRIVAAALGDRQKLAVYIELCALYWHFLLGLWGLLFMLLVSKPATYNAIVEFCGLGAL
jgi:cytochrome c oxidase subunit 3